MAEKPWLVVIDMQHVFAKGSPWASPMYAEASRNIRRLIPAFEERVVFTRYVAPAVPDKQWVAYFQDWPFALVPAEDHLYEFTDEFDPVRAGHPIVTRETFGKWSPELVEATKDSTEFVLTGVATDCCVISTALAMADAGVHARVAAKACGGSSLENHAKALDVMALYAPLVEVTSTDDVLASLKS